MATIDSSRRVFLLSLLTSSSWIIASNVTRMAGQESPRPRILFLHLRLAGGKVQLLKASVRPGTLKDRAEHVRTRAIDYEVLSNTGGRLQQGSIADPTFQRLEYEDPAQPGVIRHKDLVSESAEFVLRVRHDAAAGRVRFLRAIPRSGAVSQAAARAESLGTIELPALE